MKYGLVKGRYINIIYRLIFLLLVVISKAYAQMPENPKLLESVGIAKPRVSINKENPKDLSEVKPKASTAKLRNKIKIESNIKNELGSEPGNLPSYAVRADPLIQYQSAIVLPQNKNSGGENLESIHIGDILKCRISQKFQAYENSQIPVRAIITEGEFKSGILLGLASMDAKTKVVRISFTELRTPKDEVYSFTGGVYAKSGEELEGEYETHYWKYFWSEALLSATQGYAQGSVKQSKNAYGQYETQNNPENAVKIGVAAGFSTTVKELSERVKSAPEYTSIEGPIFVEVMVLRQAKKI